VAKYHATAERDAFDGVKQLQETHDIGSLDMVIANASVSFVWPSVAKL